ncbi:MAG: carbohydrate kinase family protein [Candidatus Staskawiczbacteria bacterium]|nr:carbohydrate kinase family protein [Candidatus Staskawiczbacteria bacterium]
MFDIITFGSATQDIIVKPKNLTILKYGKDEEGSKNISFPVGSKVDIEEMEFYSGGGGTNTAATFALQGLKTAFCGTIGLDVSGQEIINELKGFKINTGLVQKTDKKLTNHSIIILNNGKDRTILAYRGAAELMDAIPFNKIKAKWLYLAPLSGLLVSPSEALAKEGATLFEQIVNFAVDKKMKIAVNPGIAQLSLPNFADVAKKIDVLILNEEEASFLTKVPFGQEKATADGGVPQNAGKIFEKIDEICPGIAVMTRGSEGAVVSDGKTMYSAVPPRNRNIVDTTGAGDAFGAGFLAELIRSNDIEKAVQFGMGNSVGCISQVGAKHGLLKKGQEFEKVEVKKENIINT